MLSSSSIGSYASPLGQRQNLPRKFLVYTFEVFGGKGAVGWAGWRVHRVVDSVFVDFGAEADTDGIPELEADDEVDAGPSVGQSHLNLRRWKSSTRSCSA